MNLIYRFLVLLMAAGILTGCTAKEKSGTPKNEPTKPKKFERVFPPAIMTDFKEQTAYVVTHYWDKFDFRDTMYCHLPDITDQAFVDFIHIFPQCDYPKVVEGVNRLLDSAQVEQVMYNYFFKLAEHYLYDPNSMMRNDEFYIPFLEHIVNSPKVTDVSKIRPQQLLQLAKRNRPGAKAEDFVYTTASGSKGRLHAIKARYTLLIFQNPDCKECQQTTEQLKSMNLLTAAVASGQLKVLAVYPDEDLEIWRKHLKDLPPSWINSYDQGATVRNKELYDLKAIPTLYLLDENKQVLLKDTTIEGLLRFLEQL